MSYVETAYIKPYGVTTQWSEGRGAQREFMSPFVQARYAAHVVGLGAVLSDVKPEANLAVRTALDDFISDFGLFMEPGTVKDYTANPVVVQNVRDTLDGALTLALTSEAKDFRTVYVANSAQQMNFARSMAGYCAINDMYKPERGAQKIRNALDMAGYFMDAFPELLSSPEFAGNSYEASLEYCLSTDRFDKGLCAGAYHEAV